MKAEERHELQENDLMTWLQYGLWAFLKQNGSYVLLVLAFSFLGYQLWSLYQKKQLDLQRNAWEELRAAETTEDPLKSTQEVIDKYDIKPVQAQANLALGLFYDRLVAMPEELAKRKLSRQSVLDTSYDSFKKALELNGSDNLVAAKADLGMAAVEEDRGEWDKAKKIYESMADKNGRFAGTPFLDLAQDRLKTLEDREKAPRLAAMIPPPEPPKPLLMPNDTGISPGGLPGGFPGGISGSGSAPLSLPLGGTGGGMFGAPTQSSPFPGIIGAPLGPPTPSTPTAPEAPKSPPSAVTPAPSPAPASK